MTPPRLFPRIFLILIVVACVFTWFPPSLAGAAGDGGGAGIQAGEPLLLSDAANFYRYTDERGVIHMVDDPAKILPKYRSRIQVIPNTPEPMSRTRVTVYKNQVLVPVKISYRGTIVSTSLLLDTGASITILSEELARRLGIGDGETGAAIGTMADGRLVMSRIVSVDSVSVGPKTVGGLTVSILEGSSGEGYEGLLGMNFLKEFSYRIDYRGGLIEWGG